jgi:hypothetical protein
VRLPGIEYVAGFLPIDAQVVGKQEHGDAGAGGCPASSALR